MQTENNPGVLFARLQRSVVALELCAALGKPETQVLSQVKLYLKDVEDLFIKRNLTNEEQMAKNSTTKTIPEGTKTPKNNQGTKPSPVKGSTTGDNSDASQFKKSGNTTKATRK